MKDKVNSPQGLVKLGKARRLMDQGRCQESLALALEALLQELASLRDAFLALQTATRLALPDSNPASREEPPRPEPYWLPAVTPRVLH